MKKLLRLLFSITASLYLTNSAGAQITAFSYSGELNDAGVPANGSYVFRFTLYGMVGGVETPVGPVIPGTNSVIDGAFTVTLDFGNVFDGSARWLGIEVHTNNNTALFTALTPHVPVAATPYAIAAETVVGGVAASQITGTLNPTTLADGSVDSRKIANAAVARVNMANEAVDSTKLADGSVSSTKILNAAVDESKLADSSVTSAKVANAAIDTAKLSDQSVTTSKIADTSVTAAKLGDGSVTVQKLAANSPSPGEMLTYDGSALVWASMATGMLWSTIGNTGTDPNLNFLGTTDLQALELRVNNLRALRINPGPNVPDSWPNLVGGGWNSSIDDQVTGATIAGGAGHEISLGGDYASILGGRSNAVAGFASLAAGRQAKANHNNTFVWSDGNNNADFTSTANNQFLISANGGVGINKNNPSEALDVNGNVKATAFIGDGSQLTGISFSLADEAVTTPKLAADAVTTPKIADNTITTSKLSGQAVTAAKLADGAVDANKLAAGTPSANQVLTYNGSALTWTSPSGGGGASWLLSGNSGTAPNINFLGTTDNQPLSFRVNNWTALRLLPHWITGGPYPAPSSVGGSSYNQILGADNDSPGSIIAGGGSARPFDAQFIAGSAQLSTISGGAGNAISNAQYSVIAGGQQNWISTYPGSIYGTIGGGYRNRIYLPTADAIDGNTISGGYQNSIEQTPGNTHIRFAFIGSGLQNINASDGGVIGGGYNNTADSSLRSFIGGGYFNRVTNANHSAIAGGLFNVINGLAAEGFIGGGNGNSISGAFTGDAVIGGGNGNQTAGGYSFIGAGGQNTISNQASYAVITGGQNNKIGAGGTYAMIPGGDNNFAWGYSSFAAGHYAKALHNGAFVWADYNGLDFTSTANNQFLIRASGNVGINKNNPATALDVAGTVSATAFVGSGTSLAGVVLSSSATTANTPNTVVKRDANGDFATRTITLANNLNLPTTTASAGIIYSGSDPVFHAFGAFNLFAGAAAGNFTTSGAGGNVGIGPSAMRSLTTGWANAAVGSEALRFNGDGSYNTALGHQALYSNGAGSGNMACGGGALNANTTGSNNVAVGLAALGFNTTGKTNIAVGTYAGVNLTTGDNNIVIGNAGVAGDSRTIRIGTKEVQTNTFISGIWGTTVAGGVGVYIDGDGHLGTLTSSARFKENIQTMEDASSALYSLRPVTFRYKPELDPQTIAQFGLVAEEVEKVDPDLVARDDKNQVYTVRYEAVYAMLLNEFLKQHRKVEEQTSEIHTLRERLEKLEQLMAQQNGGAK